MVLSDDRDGLLLALQSMGVDLPTKTIAKLSTKDIDKKLKKALYLSQRLKINLREGSSLDISSLDDWSAASSVGDGLVAQIKETVSHLDHESLRSWTMRSEEFRNLPFIILQSKIMALANAFDEKITIHLFADRESRRDNVALRVSRLEQIMRIQ